MDYMYLKNRNLIERKTTLLLDFHNITEKICFMLQKLLSVKNIILSAYCHSITFVNRNYEELKTHSFLSFNSYPIFLLHKLWNWWTNLVNAFCVGSFGLTNTELKWNTLKTVSSLWVCSGHIYNFRVQYFISRRHVFEDPWRSNQRIYELLL